SFLCGFVCAPSHELGAHEPGDAPNHLHPHAYQKKKKKKKKTHLDHGLVAQPLWWVPQPFFRMSEGVESSICHPFVSLRWNASVPNRERQHGQLPSSQQRPRESC